jgi:putative aminopeptidase FrvX
LEREQSTREAVNVAVPTEGLPQLLAELDTIPGVSRAEEEVAEFVKGELDGCYDQFQKDALGNHFFTKEEANPQLDLMLSAHMDEVGFVIHHVDEKGFGTSRRWVFMTIGRWRTRCSPCTPRRDPCRG